MINPPILRLVPLLILTLSSCGAESAPASDSTSSNGSEAALTDATSVAGGQEGFILTKAPLLSIGSLGGSANDQFQDVRGAVRLSDGSIAVADRGAQNLRWYDASGSYLLTEGRRGAGPGEFQGLVSLFANGDTVVAFDERLQRVSVYSGDGVFVRSFQVPTQPGLVQGFFSDGSVLLAMVLVEGAQVAEGFGRSIRGTYHLDATGQILDTLPAFPDREEIIRTVKGGGGRRAIMAVPPPFGMETVFAVRGHRFAVGDQVSPEVRVYHQGGELVPSITWDGTDRTVTGQVLAQHREYLMSRAEGPEARRRTERTIQEYSYPDSLPAHGRILFDPRGNLWVESYQLPGQGPVPWEVFGEGGERLGRVELPERFHAFEIGGDYVLGKWWDDLDVEHIQLYGLVGPGTQPT